jgi:hypothetical protein
MFPAMPRKQKLENETAEIFVEESRLAFVGPLS